jgi:hypothetical protein
MAQSQRPERDGEAEFVRQVVTDPRNVPDVMRLYGYLGASSEENHERLYLNPDLSVYVEVPTGAVLHRVAASAEQDPNRGVTLWVRRDAALIYKSAPAAQALAQYFAGAIAGAAAAGAAAMPAAAMPLFQTGLTHCHIPPPTLLCTYGPPQCPPTYGVSVCCHSYVPCTPACQLAGGPGAAGMAAASPHTLCAAGGVLCTPDCPTHPDRCGVTPICQVTAVCQPTRETPCFPPPPTQGCGGGGTLHVPCTAHPCVPDVAALAAVAPQAALGGYGTNNWLCFQTPACPSHGAGCGGRGGGPVGIAAMGLLPISALCTEICTRVTPCIAPTPRGECLVSLPAVCQVSPVGFCGESVAVCGPQGSIACGGSVACGVGVGQGFGQAAPAMAAMAPQPWLRCVGGPHASLLLTYPCGTYACNYW